MVRLKREHGFTIIEMALAVAILGVAMGIVMLNYAGSRDTLSLTSASSEVEALLKRAYNITMQEGVDVYLAFWDGTGGHPNSSAIHRVYPDGGNEWTDGTPTETPPPGVKADTDGSGHYWFKLAGGAASVQETVTLVFRREGTVVSVASVTGVMSVTVEVSGKTKTVSINERGEVTKSI